MTPYFSDETCDIYHGDALTVLRELPSQSVNCCVTSPPYWGLRDYGVPGQMGLESTPEQYVAAMVAVFAEVRRVLADDGTLWLNLGDSYSVSEIRNRQGQGSQADGFINKPDQDFAKGVAQVGRKIVSGLKPKDLVGIPWRVAFALQADGWYLRSDIIWHKPNPMPESVTDRPTKAHEYIFLLAKSERYAYDAELIAEKANTDWLKRGGSLLNETGWHTEARGHDTSRRDDRSDCNGEKRNRRSVWEVATQPYPGAHFATFPPDLIKPCILAGCPAGGTVLDPFLGSGTTAQVARQLSCKCVGIELNKEYIDLAKKRLRQKVLNY